jgi:hypothetical protein
VCPAIERAVATISSSICEIAGMRSGIKLHNISARSITRMPCFAEVTRGGAMVENTPVVSEPVCGANSRAIAPAIAIEVKLLCEFLTRSEIAVYGQELHQIDDGVSPIEFLGCFVAQVIEHCGNIYRWPRWRRRRSRNWSGWRCVRRSASLSSGRLGIRVGFSLHGWRQTRVAGSTTFR